MNNLLKWCLLLVVATTFSTTVSFAQEDDQPLMEDGFIRGGDGFNIKQRIFIGGNVGLAGFSESFIGFNLSPFVGVRLTDQLHAGLGFNYAYQAQKQGTTTIKANLYGYKIFAKYLVVNLDAIGSGRRREPGDPIGGVYALVEYEDNVIKAKDNFGNAAEIESPPAFYLGIGYQQNFYRKFGFFTEATYNVINKDDTVFPVGLRAGVYYGF